MGDMTLFDYAALAPVDANEVRAAAERIRIRMKRTAEDIIAIGSDLMTVKERLPHGAFLPWIGAEFGMSQPTASRFMAVAETYGGKSFNLNSLTPSVLYELAAPSTPESVRQEVEAKAESGEHVSVEEVKRLKREAEQSRTEKEQAEAAAERYKRQAETALDGQRELVAKAERETHDRLAADIEKAKADADIARKAMKDAQAEQTRLVAAAKEAAEADARGRAEKLASDELAKRKAALDKADADLKKVVADIERRNAALAAIEQGIEQKQKLDQRLSSVDYETRELLKGAEEIVRQQALFMVVLDDIDFMDEHPDRVRKIVAQLSDQCGKLQQVLDGLYRPKLRVVEING